MSPRLAFAVDAAFRGGRSTLAHFQTGAAVERKADASPVTIADKNAERLIREAIIAAFPGELILGEEEGGDVNAPEQWIIDPIDGTKSFVAGVPLYATLLSYEVDGRPIVGVCYFPALDEMLFAELGSGTVWNGRPARVSKRETLNGSILCAAGHKSQAKFGRSEGLNRAAERALATRTWCDAYGHALVATGRAEAMLDPVVARYDISAMRIIVEEAGGKCSAYDGGDPFRPRHPNGDYEFVTSNGLVHDELLDCFR